MTNNFTFHISFGNAIPCPMGKYIADHGGTVVGFYTRTESSGRESAQFAGTKYVASLDSLIEGSDTLFITTTDGAIKETWDCIAKRNVKGKVICHWQCLWLHDILPCPPWKS